MDYKEYTTIDFATDDLFIRWVKANDPDIDRIWTEWSEKHPQKMQEVRAAKRLVQSIKVREDTWSSERQEQLRNRILASANQNALRRRKTRLMIQRFAAVLIGTLVISIIVHFILQDERLVYRTGYGITEEIVLPDRSRVILSANSHLMYREPWWSDERLVELDGEAFFEVMKVSDQGVFVVKSGGIATRVLGTEFKVRSRRDTVQVVLTAGSVQLSTQNENNEFIPITLQPGELVEYGARRILRKEKVDTTVYSGLRRRLLIFEKTQLADVAQQVEDLFGCSLRFPKTLENQTFSAKVPLSLEGLTVLKSLIAESFEVKIISETDSIVYFKY